MAKENETLEEKVANAITEASSELAPTEGTKKERKLDDEGEFFVRRIAEEVTKSIATLFPKAEAKEEAPDSDDEEEDSPTKRKKRKAPAPQPKKTSFLDRLKFPR